MFLVRGNGFFAEPTPTVAAGDKDGEDVANAKGLGDRVGDEDMGEGDGVRAKGLNGMCPTDFLLFGE